MEVENKLIITCRTKRPREEPEDAHGDDEVEVTVVSEMVIHLPENEAEYNLIITQNSTHL